MDNNHNIIDAGDGTQKEQVDDQVLLMEKPFDPTLIKIETKMPFLDTVLLLLEWGYRSRLPWKNRIALLWAFISSLISSIVIFESPCLLANRILFSNVCFVIFFPIISFNSGNDSVSLFNPNRLNSKSDSCTLTDFILFPFCKFTVYCLNQGPLGSSGQNSKFNYPPIVAIECKEYLVLRPLRSASKPFLALF